LRLAAMEIIKLSSYFRNQHLTLILLHLIKPYKYKWLRSPAGVLIYPCHFMNHRIDNVGKMTDTPRYGQTVLSGKLSRP
jgi:hypothetical protein